MSQTQTDAQAATTFYRGLLTGWLWIYCPFLVLNFLIDFPGLNDSVMSFAGGLATGALLLTMIRAKRIAESEKS